MTNVADEELGNLARMQADVFERVRKGSLNFEYAKRVLQIMADGHKVIVPSLLLSIVGKARMDRWNSVSELREYLWESHPMCSIEHDLRKFLDQKPQPSFVYFNDRKPITLVEITIEHLGMTGNISLGYFFDEAHKHGFRGVAWQAAIDSVLTRPDNGDVFFGNNDLRDKEGRMLSIIRNRVGSGAHRAVGIQFTPEKVLPHQRWVFSFPM